MEKRTRSYDLEVIKQVFSSVNQLRMTFAALKNARAIGFSQQKIVDAIQQIEKKDFVKSMTTHGNHRIWQDVYHSKFDDFELYIKFQKDDMGYFVISFKEK